MSDDILTVVPALATGVLGALVGWLARTHLWRRRLRRRQRFFGLPAGAECLLVVNQDSGRGSGSVARQDAFALLELSALIRECGAEPDIQAHDAVRQGFGVRTEFCVGGPVANRRVEAHLRSLLPGVAIDTGTAGRAGDGTITVGGETYRAQKGEREYALLARLTAPDGHRPVFLACGQRSVTNQAAVRYLARHHQRLIRRFGADGSFCLLLRAVNSEAYGPDLTELVADVTAAATKAPPAATGAAPAKETKAAKEPKATAGE
jgi:hypothetical protein